jgi:diguanylate cyclase (GGDEF)-like protein/PAS domain S-box-containing protein
MKKKKDLRLAAEEFIHKEGKYNDENLEDLSFEEIKLLVHELKVHQIELEMQNEELRRTHAELEQVKAKYFDIYDLAPEGYLILSEDGQIIETNLTAATMLGQARRDLTKKQLTHYISKEDQDSYYLHRKELFESLEPQECELRMLKNDGSLFWGHIKATAVIDDGIPMCRLVLSDVTKRKTIEIQLQQSMDDLLESQRIARLGTWRMDLVTNEIAWSEELYKIYGLDPTGSPPPFIEHIKLFTPEGWEKLSTAIEQTKTSGIPYELELETVLNDGSHGWMWVRGEGQKDSKGHVISLWGAAQDITERKKNEEKLFYLSNHDHLTGLHNRRYFERELERLDTKENLPLSIIMFDVNGLKLVNDSFGHELGDVLFKKAAETINQVSRDEDIVARIGGDEFVLVLPKTSAYESVEIANQIKALTTKEIVANIELSISYGYDTKELENQSISTIVENAENFMYKYKLYERTSLRSKTIELIMTTLFEKSHGEKQHSNRVSSICHAIALEMKLDKDIVKQMGTVGLIHDIGKIGVDEKILNKTGKLTNGERVDIEKHPEIGWRLLSSTNEFAEFAQLVIDHHEKWDGTGYPHGLKGEAIHLEARILSIAEAYDAMTTKKSYRKELTKEEAIKELMRCSGTRFDPEIVKVFVNRVLSDSEKL